MTTTGLLASAGALRSRRRPAVRMSGADAAAAADS